MLDYLAIVLTKVYNVTVVIPRWVLILITGSIGSLLVNLMHSSRGLFSSSKPKSEPDEAPTTSNAEAPIGESSSVVSPAKSGPSRRKAGKK